MIPIEIMLGSLVLGLGAGFLLPRRTPEFPVVRRRIANLLFWIINIVLLGLVFSSPTAFRNQLSVAFGLTLPTWPLRDGWISFAIAFLLLDFLRYAVHRCEHAVPMLWRLHAVHHSDPDVDVTTSVRHHPIESLIAASVYWLAVVLFDIPAIVVATYSLAVFVAAVITHTNTRFPQWVERTLQPWMITLELHLIHHSLRHEEANSNYGAVLTIWDHLFGTFMPASRDQLKHLTFGVRDLPYADCVELSGMFRTPWRLGRAISGGMN